MSARNRQINVIFEPILVSPSMRQLDRILRTIAEKDVVITLVGESGTGKEVLARRIHELSSRRAQPFVPINCGAIPEPLFESELFGHEKGAFTGASHLVHGKIEGAHGGTLFLDEIGELTLPMQVKLLRFLENRRFMRVGGSKKVSVDVRLVCATLCSLEEEVQAGRFRKDLYYRINGVLLEVPPLRERTADIAPLIQQIMAEVAAKHRVVPGRLTRSAVSALRAYAWPGNVRELRNVIELACLLRAGRAIRFVDLPLRVQNAAPLRAERNPDVRARSQTMQVRLDRSLDETIDQIIQAAVEIEGGSQSRAAERLRIGLRTVQRHLGRARPAQGETNTADLPEHFLAKNLRQGTSD
jgi:transcriptional regulator with PAS, ATPase and Fis domain